MAKAKGKTSRSKKASARKKQREAVSALVDSMARGPGQPTAYKPEFTALAKQLCELGATDPELADFFGVDERTIYRWQIAHPEFCRAVKAGKDHADDRVERSLYQRALGYSHPDTHISNFQGDVTITPITKHYPPDATSCIFWLKNRRKAEWRDKIDHSHSGIPPSAPATIIIGGKPR